MGFFQRKSGMETLVGTEDGILIRDAWGWGTRGASAATSPTAEGRSCVQYH